MAQPRGAGDLKDRVRFERRGKDGNGDEGLGDWETYIPLTAASLTPTRGGEQVIAQRLTGVIPYDLWVRWDRTALTVTADMRVVDRRTDRAFNIKAPALDLTGAGKWLLFQLELGKADG